MTDESVLGRLAWPVRTERLVLRPSVASDAEATWAYRSLPEVHRWITSAPPTFEDYAEYFADPGRLGKTIVIELDGLVIGDLMLAVEDAWAQSEVKAGGARKQAELGWSLSPSHQGKGYARESIEALIGLCFDELGIHRLVASCFADNEASWRLMERIGMRREAYTVRDALHRELGWTDGMTYALLEDEWPRPAIGASRGDTRPSSTDS